MPDATTLLKFRRLLETHDLTRRLLDEVTALLTEKKLILREGTLMDATIISQAHALLHGKEKRAGVEAGYTGVEKRPEIIAPGREIDWRLAAKRSTLATEPDGFSKALGQAWEKVKARVRARVEHPFHIVKNLFRYRKVRYRGLAKNTSQQRALFALANLYKVRRHLLPAAA